MLLTFEVSQASAREGWPPSGMFQLQVDPSALGFMSLSMTPSASQDMQACSQAIGVAGMCGKPSETMSVA